MADSASYAACGQRAATRRHRWANGQVVVSKFLGGESLLEDKRENDLRMSQVRPGRRPADANALRMESREPGLADGR